jgi:hypothetical protein
MLAFGKKLSGRICANGDAHHRAKSRGTENGGCTILYNVGNHTLAELLDFPTMDDPPEVAAEKQRRLLEMTPAKNAPVSA